MKVYVAGPMRGYADLNFPEFYRVANLLREVGHDVFNPAAGTGGEITQDRLRKWMAQDLQWICLHAEAIALLDGWPESKGACAERAAALALGLKVAPYWDLLTGDCR